MKAERLLQKLQLQAAVASERERQERRYEAAHPTVKPEVQEDQKISRICNLRKRTNDIRFQLELDKQLKLEEEKLLKASVELREANMTSAERKARAEEVRRGQILFSRLVPENHPDWRQQENPYAEFYRQQRKPKF